MVYLIRFLQSLDFKAPFCSSGLLNPYETSLPHPDRRCHYLFVAYAMVFAALAYIDNHNNRK